MLKKRKYLSLLLFVLIGLLLFDPVIRPLGDVYSRALHGGVEPNIGISEPFLLLLVGILLIWLGSISRRTFGN